MFKKLVSNLPFNPSLINQVSFYSKRLKREASVRRLGVIFVVLAMAIQVFAIISPPKPTLARSGNDLIDGGISSRGDAVFACQNNVGSYGDILAHFDISCDNVANAQTVTLHSNDYGGQLYSMGRIAYGKAGETPVNVSGTNYWLRYLWSWDSWGSWSTYTALQGTGKNGQTFFILYDCGNLVFIGIPPAPRPQPVCLNWYQGWGFWYQSPDGDVNNATKTTRTDPCAAPKPTPVCDSWYQGWGFWYQSPDGDVNNATKTTKTNPCTSVVMCPTNASIPITDAACKPCEAAQSSEDKTACLEFSKKARNETQNIADANGTTAKPGDIITYTLYAKNIGKEDVPNFVIQENISDILDYSNIDSLNGASLDKSGILSWPAINVKANSTEQRQFTVKVKNPLPNTPASVSDPGHFDWKMTNVYGNTVTINLPPNVVKTTESATHALPNTGPGSSLAIGFGVVVIAAYFFMRSRLMAKELELVKSETVSGGL